MTETPKEPAPGPPQPGRSASHRDTHRVPIHLTASPDLVDLALAYVADGSISNPETPALLRRIASAHLGIGAACAPELEPPAPPLLPISDGFVLVDYAVRPGVRGYRLAKLPANVPWRIRIGAFERHVHRTLVIFVRCVVRFLTTRMVLTPESKVSLLVRRGRDARRDALGHLLERTSS